MAFAKPSFSIIILRVGSFSNNAEWASKIFAQEILPPGYNDLISDVLHKLIKSQGRSDTTLGIINHIGGALRDWVPKLSCYAEYARGLVLKRKKLEDCFNEEKVQAFLTTAESAKFARKLTIWSFLDAPRSNLPRLKLQVNHFDSINGESTADGLRFLYIRFLEEKSRKSAITKFFSSKGCTRIRPKEIWTLIYCRL